MPSWWIVAALAFPLGACLDVPAEAAPDSGPRCSLETGFDEGVVDPDLFEQVQPPAGCTIEVRNARVEIVHEPVEAAPCYLRTLTTHDVSGRAVSIAYPEGDGLDVALHALLPGGDLVAFVRSRGGLFIGGCVADDCAPEFAAEMPFDASLHRRWRLVHVDRVLAFEVAGATEDWMRLGDTGDARPVDDLDASAIEIRFGSTEQAAFAGTAAFDDLRICAP